MTRLLIVLAVACAFANTANAQQDRRATVAFVHATVLTMDDSMRVIQDGYVTISEGHITGVGTGEPPHADQRIDAHGGILMPGFVNTHTHAAMSLFKGIANDDSLHTWLRERIWPIEKAFVDSAFVRVGAQLASIEMIQSGTTTFNDMYFFEDVLAQTVSQIGLRACVCECVFDFPSNSFSNGDDALKASERLIRGWQGNALITPFVCPHSVYTCSDPTLTAAKALSDRYHTRLHMHLSETKQEGNERLLPPDNTPTELIQRLGLLDSSLIAVHAVWLSNGDMLLFDAAGATVSHCPTSNLKLGSGIADIDALIDLGIRVSIGTDGSASNNDVDMLAEANLCAMLQKGRSHDPTQLPASLALMLATRGGAEALGLVDIIGSVEVGKAADLILFDVSGVRSVPLYDPYAAVLYSMSSSDISDVMVQGRFLLRSRQLTTIDFITVMNEARSYQERIKEWVKTHVH